MIILCFFNFGIIIKNLVIVISITTLFLVYFYIKNRNSRATSIFLFVPSLLTVTLLGVAFPFNKGAKDLKIKEISQIMESSSKGVKLEGVVASYRGLIEDSDSITLNLEELAMEGVVYKTGGFNIKVLVNVSSPMLQVLKGRRVSLVGEFREIKNFDGFDYNRYLNSKNIYFVFNCEKLSVLGVANKLNYSLSLIKRKISINIERSFPSPHSSLLAGIVFGERGSISLKFQEKLQASGTIHIVAVSGYNVSLLVNSTSFLVFLFGRKFQRIFSLLFIIIFTFFVGIGNIPVLRAGIMGIVIIISKFIGRKNSFYFLFLIVLTIMLVINPLVFYQLSFQLSVFSTLGIVLLTDKLSKKFRFIPDFLREDFSSTISALLFTIPITLLNFRTLPIIAPVANLIVLPSITYITILGFCYILVFFIPIIKIILEIILWGLIEFVVIVVNHLGSIKIANITLSNDFVIYVLCLMIVMIIVDLIRPNE